jgi:hypothetical protein
MSEPHEIAVSKGVARALEFVPFARAAISDMALAALREALEKCPDLRDSLTTTETITKHKAARQSDVRDQDGRVLFKLFMRYDPAQPKWTIYVEHASETWFEDNQTQSQLN